MGSVGATAVGGMYSLSNLGCKPSDEGSPAFVTDVGYTRLTVDPGQVVFESIKTGRDPTSREYVEGDVGDTLHRLIVT
ncbi:MAG: hypothetical protein GXP29_07960 [Planctomycetes bacterium]|nr:hypothetical protein [Planctomycetota bacterium]